MIAVLPGFLAAISMQTNRLSHPIPSDCMHDSILAGLAAFHRPHYFAGRMLTASDLEREQEYHRAHARLHNQLLHGWGVVSGLDVRSTAGRIVVSPGLALDPAGNVVVLPQECVLSMAPSPSAHAALFVVVRYSETPTDPVVVGDGTEFLCTEEAAACSISPSVPKHPDTGIAIARIIWRTTQWRVDGRYRRRRVRT